MATSTKAQAWFCTTGLPSDVVVDVDNMTFHLHKIHLMDKSRKLHELIKEQETKFSSGTAADQRSLEQENEEIEKENEVAAVKEEQYCHISFPDFPGGSETFEIAAKFSYAVKIELSPSNVAPLRCAGDVLEMTEEYCEDNLVLKTERFLSQTVLRNLSHTIETLKSCERLMPLAESLGIVERCIVSITAKVSSMDPSLFRWPVNEETPSLATAKFHARGVRGMGDKPRATAVGDRWLDELTLISPQLFKRLIMAMKGHDLNYEIIENSLLRYAQNHIPGINRTSRKPLPTSKPSEIEQEELLETIVTNLPEQNCSGSSAAVKLYFGLLRTANILNSSDESKSVIEKKIGSQFEQATLDDLLMPSYSYLSETLYDVDCVQRILEKFLHSTEDNPKALMLVGKLIDGYLSEIALDANLKPERFYQIAVALPEQARIYDDGLYRSVDVYIKAHPSITEADRERISGVLDWQKLTLEACTHAAQNDRLPLRAMVQVLFFEQLQLRRAIAGTLMAAEIGMSDLERSLTTQQEEADINKTVVGGDDGTCRAAVRENQVLRLGMDSMRTRVHELEHECTTMRKAIEKIDKVQPSGWKGSLTKKFGCAFQTQVCASHEPTVVETRKGLIHRTHHHSNR